MACGYVPCPESRPNPELRAQAEVMVWILAAISPSQQLSFRLTAAWPWFVEPARCFFAVNTFISSSSETLLRLATLQSVRRRRLTKPLSCHSFTGSFCQLAPLSAHFPVSTHVYTPSSCLVTTCVRNQWTRLGHEWFAQMDTADSRACECVNECF